MHMEGFKIKAYGKSELALMYFPEAMPAAALRRLSNWIRNCRGLSDSLLEAGYDKRSKYLTPRQVEIIIGMLGEP